MRRNPATRGESLARIFAWAWPSNSATWKKSAHLSSPSSSTSAEINNSRLGWESL
jgi:hypothetical protein